MEDHLSLLPYILQLEQEGRVTRTFRRLDPARQQAVLFAILDEAAAHGPAALNMKDVARRAGVAVGSLYQYFRDRDTMLAFAVELTVRSIQDAFEQYIPALAAMPLRAGLEAYLLGGIEWSRAWAGRLQLFSRAAYQGDPALAETLVRPVAAALRQAIRAMLAAAQARGELRPDLDLEAAARLTHTFLIAVGDSQLLPYLNRYYQLDPADLAPAIDFILRSLEAAS